MARIVTLTEAALVDARDQERERADLADREDVAGVAPPALDGLTGAEAEPDRSEDAARVRAAADLAARERLALV